MLIVLIIILVLIILLFAIYLIYSYKKIIKDINLGELDIDIIYDYISHNKEKNTLFKVISLIGKGTIDIVFIVLFIIFIFSLISKISNTYNMPYQILVVASNSMSYKNEENIYLENINNQFNKYDLIIIKTNQEINLYDVVCYKKDNKLIIHRVIEIKDNGYITRGDANNISDELVNSNDIIGVYNNVRIPYLGYIVFYLQSSYGISAVIFIYLLLIIYSIYDSKVKKIRLKRFKEVYKNELILSNSIYKLETKNNTFILYKNNKIIDSGKFKTGEL